MKFLCRMGSFLTLVAVHAPLSHGQGSPRPPKAPQVNGIPEELPNASDAAVAAYEQAFLAFQESRTKGDRKAAIQHYEQVVELTPRVADFDAYVSAMQNLANFYSNDQQYDKSLAQWRRVQRRLEDHYGRQCLESLEACRRQSAIYGMLLFRWRDADALLKEAQSILDAHSGKASAQQKAQLESDWAHHYSRHGQTQKAITHGEAALRLLKEFDAKSTDVARVLMDLAGDYASLQRFDVVEEYSQQAASIIADKNLEDTLLITGVSTARGNLALMQGDLKRAEQHFQKTLAIGKSHVGADHPYIAMFSEPLAEVLVKSHAFDRAEPLLKDSVRIVDLHYPSNHPYKANSRHAMAQLFAEKGEWNPWTKFAGEACRQEHAFSTDVLTYYSEQDQLAYLMQPGGATDNFHRLITTAVSNRSETTVAAASMEWAVNLKGAAYDALIRRQALARQLPCDVFERWIDIKERQAQLSGTEVASASLDERQSLQAAEADLLAKFGTEVRGNWVELSSIRAKLPEDSVLIDFIRYRVTNVSTDILKADRPTRYAAWIIFADKQKSVKLVDICDADEISGNLKAFPERMRDGGSITEEELREGLLAPLSQKLLGPLLAADGGIDACNRWIVSPDSEIWCIPWEALLLESGEYVVQRKTVSYVVAARDLLRAKGQPTSSPPVILRAANGKAASTDWIDVDACQAWLEAVTRQQAQVADASEGRFKQLKRPRVLMVNCHGRQTAKNQPLAARAGDDWVNPYVANYLILDEITPGDDAPQALQPADDGKLTAMEVSALDFSDTDVVGLAACESGSASIPVELGEGAANLRQAFHMAGSRVVIASLWSVPAEESTKLWQFIFQSNDSLSDLVDALTSAKRELIKIGHSHPYDWAGFTISGAVD